MTQEECKIIADSIADVHTKIDTLFEQYFEKMAELITMFKENNEKLETIAEHIGK